MTYPVKTSRATSRKKGQDSARKRLVKQPESHILIGPRSWHRWMREIHNFNVITGLSHICLGQAKTKAEIHDAWNQNVPERNGSMQLMVRCLSSRLSISKRTNVSERSPFFKQRLPICKADKSLDEEMHGTLWKEIGIHFMTLAWMKLDEMCHPIFSLYFCAYHVI